MYQKILKKTLLGPELAKSAGVLSVVLLHTALLIPRTSALYHEGNIWRIVYTGDLFLDLFFAMSGFFIGTHLIQDMNQPIKKSITEYIYKRCSRILPTYFIVLFLASLWEIFLTGECPSIIWHIFFLQHYSNNPYFLGVAWFLDVEVWSYILLPCIIFFFQKLLPARINVIDRIIIASLICIVCATLARGITVFCGENIQLDDNIRKPVHLRFDALMYGLLVACLKENYQNIYNFFRKKTVIVALCTFLVLIIEVRYNTDYIRGPHLQESYKLFHAIFGFSVSGFIVSLFLPFIVEVKHIHLGSICSKIYCILKEISKLSYQIYILHLSFLFEFLKIIDNINNIFNNISLSFIILIIISYISCFKFSKVIYKLTKI